MGESISGSSAWTTPVTFTRCPCWIRAISTLRLRFAYSFAPARAPVWSSARVRDHGGRRDRRHHEDRYAEVHQYPA